MSTTNTSTNNNYDVVSAYKTSLNDTVKIICISTNEKAVFLFIEISF
jgi:hypothetical protein